MHGTYTNETKRNETEELVFAVGRAFSALFTFVCTVLAHKTKTRVHCVLNAYDWSNNLFTRMHHTNSIEDCMRLLSHQHSEDVCKRERVRVRVRWAHSIKKGYKYILYELVIVYISFVIRIISALNRKNKRPIRVVDFIFMNQWH